MGRKIDYDRGVMKRFHEATGVAVYMYMDDPGVYLSSQGTPMSDNLAEQAGFDTKTLGKRKLLKERLAQANANIMAELEMAEAGPKIVIERGGFKIVDIGLGRMQVHSDGENLTPQPVTLEQATMLLDSLSPEVEEVKEPEEGTE